MSLSQQQERRFYAYVYRINGVMAYAGKGCGDRAWQHIKGARNPILRQRIASAKTVQVRVIRTGMTEAEAFQLERRCIAKWKQTLCNVSQGAYSSAEAAWHECLYDLQTNVIGYGHAITRKSRALMDMTTGETVERDTMELRVRNLVWLRRQYRKLMRSIERQHPHLIS